jgi:hypothetical protein
LNGIDRAMGLAYRSAFPGTASISISLVLLRAKCDVPADSVPETVGIDFIASAEGIWRSADEGTDSRKSGRVGEERAYISQSPPSPSTQRRRPYLCYWSRGYICLLHSSTRTTCGAMLPYKTLPWTLQYRRHSRPKFSRSRCKILSSH